MIPKPSTCFKFIMALIGIVATVYIILSLTFFYILTDQRLLDLEDANFENEKNIAFMEQREAYCYPND